MTKVLFDAEIAARYDDDMAPMSRPERLEPMLDLLEALAGDGPALEFGVGTGRVALPLARRGVPVPGIALYEPMIEQLRRKPGSEQVGLTVGDFATTRVPGRFRLVYLVFDTLTNLTTQDEQVACFGNAAAHLEDGGCFVVEVGVPDLRRLPPGERVRAFDVGGTHLGFDEYLDFARQTLRSRHYWIEEGTLRTISTPHRYVWPAELDLMARLAGMSLCHRWASWSRETFGDESRTHVSVWRRAAG